MDPLQRAARRLRREAAAWPIIRWVGVIYGAATISVAVYYWLSDRAEADCLLLEQLVEYSVPLSFLYSLFAVTLFFLLLSGVFCLAWVLANWQGRPTRILLLHLLSQRSDDRPASER